MSFGTKLRQLRLQRGLSQGHVRKVLGYVTNSYVSDVENGKFIPKPEKLAKWAKALGVPKTELDDLMIEAQLEEMGMEDPAFTMMFKEIPHMTKEEKRSLIRAYEAVMRARQSKRIR